MNRVDALRGIASREIDHAPAMLPRGNTPHGPHGQPAGPAAARHRSAIDPLLAAAPAGMPQKAGRASADPLTPERVRAFARAHTPGGLGGRPPYTAHRFAPVMLNGKPAGETCPAPKDWNEVGSMFRHMRDHDTRLLRNLTAHDDKATPFQKSYLEQLPAGRSNVGGLEVTKTPLKQGELLGPNKRPDPAAPNDPRRHEQVTRDNYKISFTDPTRPHDKPFEFRAEHVHNFHDGTDLPTETFRKLCRAGEPNRPMPHQELTHCKGGANRSASAASFRALEQWATERKQAGQPVGASELLARYGQMINDFHGPNGRGAAAMNHPGQKEMVLRSLRHLIA